MDLNNVECEQGNWEQYHVDCDPKGLNIYCVYKDMTECVECSLVCIYAQGQLM